MTRWVVRHRRPVIAAWIVLLVVGAYAASNLGSLLTNRFSVPGSDAEKGLNLLKDRFHERGDGAFTLVFQARGGSAVDPAGARAAGGRAAAAVKEGKAGPLQQGPSGLAYMQIQTPLQNADAADRTPAMRRAIGSVPGARTYLTGFPAVNHDVQPIYNRDLARGEMISGLVALAVLFFMFGTLGGIIVPFLFVAASIPTTLGFVWIAAHLMDMANYVQNIVTLIGLAIAIDYSMLIVFRYREELDAGVPPAEALETTMATAGRATIFSGMTVAVGLALLAFMPLPFMQSMGVGGLLVPLVSIAASATFLPAVLSLLGGGVNRWRVIPRRVLARRAHGDGGVWSRLARSIMRRPVPYVAVAGAVMVALAVPALGLHLNGAGNTSVPAGTEAGDGQRLLERALGPGVLAPNQVAVDYGAPGAALTPIARAAEQRLVARLRADREVVPRSVLSPALVPVGRARAANLLDPTGGVAQIRVAGRHEAGAPATVSLVHRIRDAYVPAARFPASARTLVTGAPAFGVDFESTAYNAFPWLVAAVLVMSYLLLLRAFRSVILPLKAVVMNLLSVGATYGVLVLVFQHGIGKVVGLPQMPQIEAWIPIFLFAMLFGLSMDYEVFLLTRMREEWDARHDNEHAVAAGLEHTGRIITAAAIIMIAAFGGFLAGSFVGLQEFGLGLAAAILLDATLVRALLVPAAMKLLGRWNWWLPDGMRRVMRLRPSSS